MEEPDPIKRMYMFSVKCEVRGRITILKSLSLAKGTIRQQNKIQMRETNYKSFSGAQTYLTESIFKRLAHYISKRQPGQIEGGASTAAKPQLLLEDKQTKKLNDI